MKKVIILLFSALLLIACERKSERAQVRLQFPAISTKQNASISKVTAQNHGGSWGVPVPTSISDINCFAVFVGGPEASLRDKSCAKGEDSTFERFYFHHVQGFTSIQSELVFDLEPGPGRTFFVLGVKSTAGQCPAFENMNQSLISNPLLIGRAQSDLKPGDNAISISATVASDTNTQLIQECNFFGAGGPPNKLALHGGISTMDSGGTSQIGHSTCNRMRVYAESDSGGMILEEDLNLNLSQNGSIGEFYASSDCSTGGTIGVAKISRGKRQTDVFFLAPGSGVPTGTVSISAQLSTGSLYVSKAVSVTTPGGVTRIRFFEERLNLGANSCAEVAFFGTSGAGVTGPINPSTAIGVFSLNGNPQSVASVPSLSFKSFCGGSVISDFPSGAASGSFAVTMGTVSYSDFQFGHASSGKVKTNIQPLADLLEIGSLPSKVWASDCTPISVTAKTNGVIADLSGNDFSPWSIQKQIDGFININPSSSVGVYNSSICSTPDANSYSFTLTSAGTSSASKYYQFNSSGSYNYKAFPNGGIRNGSEFFRDFTVDWDPGVYTHNPSPAYATYLRSPGAAPGPTLNPTKTNWTGMSFSVGGTTSVNSDDLGMNNHVLLLTGGTLSTNLTSPSPGSLTYGMLVKFDSLPMSAPIVSVKAGPTNLATFEVSATANEVRIAGNFGGSPVVSSTVAMSNNTWYSVVVVRDVVADTCALIINGAVVASLNTCTTNTGADTLKVGYSSLNSHMAEMFIIDRALSSAEVSNFHAYLKSRYPAAGLP